MKSTIIVNFGGPRNLEEIESFLISLLTDRDVIRSRMPNFLHRFLFTRIAKKRVEKVAADYALIGGKSPIFEDTETVASLVSHLTGSEVRAFHRYLVATHGEFFKSLGSLSSDEILVFPMFPQFSYATTGSIARFFKTHLPESLTARLRWIRSYSDHPAYVRVIQQNIRAFLDEQKLEEEETVLLFSAHGLPQAFIDTGDSYQKECERSFALIAAGFPKALAKLAYQSKFGRGEWLRPYTDETCEEVLSWSEGRKNVVFIPLSFTSDHIETLYEIEELYLPIVRRKGLNALRCPAQGTAPEWTQAIAEIMRSIPTHKTEELVFKP